MSELWPFALLLIPLALVIVTSYVQYRDHRRIIERIKARGYRTLVIKTTMGVE